MTEVTRIDGDSEWPAVSMACWYRDSISQHHDERIADERRRAAAKAARPERLRRLAHRSATATGTVLLAPYRRRQSVIPATTAPRPARATGSAASSGRGTDPVRGRAAGDATAAGLVAGAGACTGAGFAGGAGWAAEAGAVTGAAGFAAGDGWAACSAAVLNAAPLGTTAAATRRVRAALML